jgi:hypothetical protein
VNASAVGLGVKHYVVGSVTRTGSGVSAELRLLSPGDSKVISQRNVDTQPNLEALSKAITVAAQELVGPLLAAEQGQLLVRTREEGAEVIVDDVSRGSTPLPAPIKLPRGKHRLTVKRDGFISRVTTATVKKDQLTLEDVTLVPSADYVASYQARNRRMRIGGLAAAGASVAAFVVAIILDRAIAEPTHVNEFKPRRDVLEAISIGTARADLFTTRIQQECFADPVACREQARAAGDTVSTMQIASWVMVGVGLAAAAGAAYCFIAGEDPNRYAQLVASLMPGGGSIGLVGHW